MGEPIEVEIENEVTVTERICSTAASLDAFAARVNAGEVVVNIGEDHLLQELCGTMDAALNLITEVGAARTSGPRPVPVDVPDTTPAAGAPV